MCRFTAMLIHYCINRYEHLIIHLINICGINTIKVDPSGYLKICIINFFCEVINYFSANDWYSKGPKSSNSYFSITRKVTSKSREYQCNNISSRKIQYPTIVSTASFVCSCSGITI